MSHDAVNVAPRRTHGRASTRWSSRAGLESGPAPRGTRGPRRQGPWRAPASRDPRRRLQVGPDLLLQLFNEVNEVRVLHDGARPPTHPALGVPRGTLRDPDPRRPRRAPRRAREAPGQGRAHHAPGLRLRLPEPGTGAGCAIHTRPEARAGRRHPGHPPHGSAPRGRVDPRRGGRRHAPRTAPPRAARALRPARVGSRRRPDDPHPAAGDRRRRPKEPHHTILRATKEEAFRATLWPAEPTTR